MSGQVDEEDIEFGEGGQADGIWVVDAVGGDASGESNQTVGEVARGGALGGDAHRAALVGGPADGASETAGLVGVEHAPPGAQVTHVREGAAQGIGGAGVAEAVEGAPEVGEDGHVRRVADSLPAMRDVVIPLRKPHTSW